MRKATRNRAKTATAVENAPPKNQAIVVVVALPPKMTPSHTEAITNTIIEKEGIFAAANNKHEATACRSIVAIAADTKNIAATHQTGNEKEASATSKN